MIFLSTNRLFLTQEEIAKKDEIRKFVNLHCEKELSTLTITEDINNKVNINLIMNVKAKGMTDIMGYIFFYREEPTRNKTYKMEFVFNNKLLKGTLEREAIKIFIEYVFNNFDVHRIISKCSPTDSSRWKLLERLSFREEGIFVKSLAQSCGEDGNIMWKDELIYAILKEEFEEFTRYEETSFLSEGNLYNKIQKKKVIYDKMLS